MPPAIPIKRFEPTTPLARMGLSPKEAKLLSPAAANVTKADLAAALAGKRTPAFLALTLQDLNTIGTVYAARARATGPGDTTTSGGGCCCCCIACCCCCCAAAVPSEGEPVN